MSTDLFWKHTCIHHTETLDTMDSAFRVDNACRCQRAHTGRAHRVIQSEGLLIHESNELLISDVLDVAAREGPPVRTWIVIHRDGFKEFLEFWTLDDLKTDANADQKNSPVVVSVVA